MSSISNEEQLILSQIQHDIMLNQILTWSAVNSGSANLPGLAQMAAMLADAFSILPADISLSNPQQHEIMKADGKVQQVEYGQHLVVTVRPDAALQLLFTGHMDTVFPVDHHFQHVTWLDKNILNGPGVADMKGGIAVMLSALHAIENSAIAEKFGYQILINSDEEVGSPSSAALIAQLAKGKAAALTYEPALPDGTLAGERGGSGNFSICINGESAHAGRNPDDGRNAVLAAADLGLQLKALSQAGLSVNPAKIEGGSPNNVVPDHAILRVNFRPKTFELQYFAETKMHEIIENIKIKHDVAVHMHGGFGRPPKPIDDKAAKLFTLVKSCGKDLGIDIKWQSTGGVCDGNNIAACGVPVVDTMGVRGGSIHSEQEFLLTDSLVERAKLSALAISRIAQKGGL
ncbi:hypothetical protein LPB140_08710 [Sphingorhabdus lutea]|uniref:Peptidase M20 dimerisation domain-containing protein n=1 Tax=Sphingorhabdus lutea TaxID=1913578 RepID=A0A1L3JCN7_9SPHN|nr:hydrolase [Sphingorhabdus lutea]APG62859.1 hypothetical protein LPB140_08710 [Sphingorhabdus lutea]